MSTTRTAIIIIFVIALLIIGLMVVNKCGATCVKDMMSGKRSISKFQDTIPGLQGGNIDLATASEADLRMYANLMLQQLLVLDNIPAEDREGLVHIQANLPNATREELGQIVFGLIFFLALAGPKREGFQGTATTKANVLNKIQTDVGQLTPEELKATLEAMRERLAKYGLLPGQEELEIDRSQWVPKSNIPPAGPRIDMSEYVKKSSIPPEKVCPPQKEIDYSEYVKKSTLPPTQKCPPCISPKVKVSAGLCKKCPPCPSCPPPQRCPEVQCPEPKACPKVECAKCDEIKYIKVPTIITRTVKVDASNNVISEEVEESTETTKATIKKAVPTEQIPIQTRAANAKKAQTCGVVGMNNDFRKFGVYGLE